jgi:hypothetical protein
MSDAEERIWNVSARISRLVDNGDGSRTLDLRLDGNGQSLLDTQNLKIIGTKWILPEGKAEPGEIKTKITNVTLNGNDITAEVVPE